MYAFKSSLLLLVLGVILIETNANIKVESELELRNVNLAPLYENEGTEPDEEIHQQDTKCDGDASCWNGGTCDNGVCKCLPGTKGPFCAIVEGCENPEEQKRKCGNPDNVYCVYNATSQKPYCRCKNLNFLYDPHYKICKECDCNYYSKCSFVNGKKKCACAEGYGLMIETGREETCVYCGCGAYSDGCTKYGYSKVVCNCKPGFSQTFISKCAECDCGPKGNCSIPLLDKKCACEKGYTEKDGKCQKCDCGEYGDCGWDDNTGDKKCNCKEGYGIKDGICVECNCYMGNDRIGCTFLSEKRMCSCPEGYEENDNSTCIDINECLNEIACPPDSDCKNTPGSYECTCKDGFRPTRESMNATTESPNKDKDQPENPELDPKVVGCEDIDECVESDICSHNETTTCLNTPGSYKCFCKEGFSIPSYEKSAEKGCKKNEEPKSWTTLYVVLGVIFGVILLGGIVWVSMRKFRR